MMILRPDYLDAIRPFMGIPTVKILTGIRRCGKSTIFQMLLEELNARGVAQESIITRRYTDMELDAFDQRSMYEDLKAAMEGKGRCCLLLDEVQEGGRLGKSSEQPAGKHRRGYLRDRLQLQADEQ